MKLTDLNQIKVNQFTNHIVVDLIIIIIITAISIFLLILLAQYKSSNELNDEKPFSRFLNYEILILVILIVIHMLFSLLPIINYGLKSTISSIELFILPFSYGLYLTFLMKKVNKLVEKKLPIFRILQFNKAFRLFFHFSIIPLLIVTILVVL